MSDRSRISIIIPTYEHAATIGITLEHVFSQTLAPAEVIVVNDGSRDHTLEVLQPFLSRVTLISQSNQGANAARNRGFRASSGDFVLFCDADVFMKPHMLERMMTALRMHPEAAFAYSAFHFGWKRFASFPFNAERLRRMNYIHTSSLMRRDAFPGFDESQCRLQDWDVWLTLLEQGGEGVYLPECLFRIQLEKGRTGISEWRPRFFFKLPWRLLGWKPASIKRFEEARNTVLRKHKFQEPITKRQANDK